MMQTGRTRLRQSMFGKLILQKEVKDTARFGGPGDWDYWWVDMSVKDIDIPLPVNLR